MGFLVCRAGAKWVVGAEVNQSMCDAGVESLVMNGMAGKCLMVNKDVRRMHAASAHRDGTPPDMLRKADLAVFEVCAWSLDLVICVVLSPGGNAEGGLRGGMGGGERRWEL